LFSLWRGTNAGRGRLVRALGEELRVGGRFRRGRAGFRWRRSVFRLSRLEEGPDGGLGRFRRHGRGGRERLRHSGQSGLALRCGFVSGLLSTGWLAATAFRACRRVVFGKWSATWSGFLSFPRAVGVCCKGGREKGRHEKRELDGDTTGTPPFVTLVRVPAGAVLSFPGRRQGARPFWGLGGDWRADVRRPHPGCRALAGKARERVECCVGDVKGG
jgi:hypothetical protein